jgi:hypothetical protein
VWQILIGRKLLGTHHAFAHPVSELYNHPTGVGLAPFSRAFWLASTAKFTRVQGADIVMESISLIEGNERKRLCLLKKGW